ncbi:hypothetical protein J3R82DRAFT_9628, partial [Butyriboletus roseoflavus]
MPKSKRSKVVSLTKVPKKTREHKNALLGEIQQSAEKWKYCWLFEVGAMRNTHLKTVRNLWRDSARIFYGKAAVMAKALGNTPEEEHQPGLHKLAEACHLSLVIPSNSYIIHQKIKGQVGLLFTDTGPQEVRNIASRTVTLPVGPVMRLYSDPPETFPHNEEPQLRKLGLSTMLIRGIPTLQTSHKICDKGKALTSEQAQLLKLIGEKMVVFRVGLKARWDSETGVVTQVESGVVPAEEEDEE